MKIEYEATIDEGVDAQWRLMEHLNTVRKWKWQGLIFTPIVFALLYYAIPDTQGVKLVFATGSSLLYIAVYLGTYKRTMRKRMRKLLVEMFGSDTSYPCEYEFEEDGLAARIHGTEIKFQWSSFTEIIETDRDLELVVGKNGIAVLPRRAFQSEQQENEWLNYVREKTSIS